METVKYFHLLSISEVWTDVGEDQPGADHQGGRGLIDRPSSGACEGGEGGHWEGRGLFSLCSDNLTELHQQSRLGRGECGDLGHAAHSCGRLGETQSHHGVGEDEDDVVDEDGGRGLGALCKIARLDGLNDGDDGGDAGHVGL